MPAAPQLQKVIKLTLTAAGGSPEDFSADVIDAAIVPAQPDEQTVTTLDGVTHRDTGPVEWALELNCVIDWDSERPGLAWFLWTHSADALAFVHNAYSASGAGSDAEPQLTGTCVAVPIPYGGTGNAFATATVSLPITGAITLDETS